MKIAVTAMGPEPESLVSSRFGRCPYFLIFDLESDACESLSNPNVTSGGGAGIQAAQSMVDHDVHAVLTGNCGPNSFRVFEAAGINIFTGVTGPARDAIESYRAGTLNPSSDANVQAHHGSTE